MTMRVIPARPESTRLTPMHLLGISLSVYTISLALFRGMSDDGAMSLYATRGVAQVIAVVFVLAGVCVGLLSMAYVIIRDSLRPLCYLAAYILAFASLALFRVEENAAVNVLNSLRYTTVAAVAMSAWLYHHRETCRAHQ